MCKVGMKYQGSILKYDEHFWVYFCCLRLAFECLCTCLPLNLPALKFMPPLICTAPHPNIMTAPLSVPDIHEAKKQSSFMFCLTVSRCIRYLNEFFDQRSIDGKTEVKVQKSHLVAETKLKVTGNSSRR